MNKITPADISDPQEVIARAKALSIELATPITPGFKALVFKASRGIEDIYELTYIRKDGSRFPAVVSVTALRDAQDAIIGYLLIGTDNTARKQAEEALLKAGALQSAIFNSANFSSIATDAKGVIQIFNVGAERMLGYTAAEVMNKITPADISDPQEVVARAKALSVELGTTITPGFEAQCVQGLEGASRTPSAADPISARDGAAPGGRLGHGAARRRRTTSSAIVTERTSELTATNKQLEAFVYSIAHDLRAPLRAMQGFSTMLVEEAGAALNETGKDYADRINKSAQFMDALLSDLLAFSRISQQRVELTSVNLETVVESVLSRLQKDIQEKNARVESSGPWPVVLAHEPTLAQVLFNLASNALKFVAPDVPPLVRLRAEEQAEFIRVWVEDNGPGIAPDHQDQIFRLFTRLDGEKYAGTGIGLAIVQKGVERMGGRVGVESAPGQGSRFWFELRKA